VSPGSFDGRGALEAVDRILNRGGEPDAVLGAILDALGARGVEFARIRLRVRQDLVDAAIVGSEQPAPAAPITFSGADVGVLEVAGADEELLTRLATLVSAVSAEGAQHLSR
jgi:hypothetical protein